VPTLAELLRARGWVTAAFVTNYLGSGVFGLDRGFDVFRFYPERGDRRAGVYLDSETLVRRVVRWLPRGPERPFFLYVHATDPHFPYLPPPRYARAFERRDVSRATYLALVEAMRPFHNGQERWGTRPAPIVERDAALLRDLYDGEIRRADAGFGVLLDALAARGLLAQTIVVLTADHGEEFLEHGGIAHGQTLYGEALHVPLLIRPPGEGHGGARRDGLAQHVDVLPTILTAAGVSLPPEVDGTPLLGADRGRDAHTSLRLAGRALDAVATTEWKVIRDLGRPRPRRFEAYRLGDDPGEHRDVAAEAPDLVARGRERIRLRDAGFTRGPRVPEERVERLRALGYVVD
jgi:arylsulfatase A-like enzyme